jgi:DNA-directed RNA polymerase specialized sigma24 family protein
VAAVYWAMCRAVRAWDPLRDASFWTYSLRAIRQQIHYDQRQNTFTTRWKVKTRVLSGESELPDVPGPPATADARDEIDHLRWRLETVLPQLKTHVGNQQAEVVRLKMRGMSFIEIAAAKGTKPQSERNLFNAAVAKIRQLA